MKQVLIRRGGVVVEDVPAPAVEPGTVLVRSMWSCISAGTELSGMRASSTPLWQEALRRPQKALRLAEVARTRGVGAARDFVQGTLAAGTATGYSLSGEVIEVGTGVAEIRTGDIVACAGAGAANHAEVVRVPGNLTVRVPDGLDPAAASTVTLGAIALQGVRRANPTLGETFVVIGLGIIGQLVAQILRSNGCRVIGLDLEPGRTRTALDLGMHASVDPVTDLDVDRIARLTGGAGADGVIITAASGSSEIVSTAFRMSRRKGRVVLVGDVGLDLDREDIYQKELDFLVSTSYGPGRYDRRYEEDGLDYPIGYVRWTENRNMAEYLRLLASKQVRVESLIGTTWPVADAPAAYAALSAPDRPLIALLSYPVRRGEDAITDRERRRIANPSARPGRDGAIRVGLIGAGEFAKGMHLPNLRALADKFELRAVASRTGHNASATAKQWNAAYSTTDVDEVFGDPEIDLVLITTRHDTHAELAMRAMRAGKHVLVEKPLALNANDLHAIELALGDAEIKPILQTGFNRRFSPHAQRISELVIGRSNPLLMTYRMNAGYLPPDHWTQREQGGGRNIGEACHIYDLFTFLTGSRVVDVQAAAVRPGTGYYGSSDNFIATMRFEDGSLGSLAYTALGSKDHPKEQLEVFVDGKVVTLNDYRTLVVSGAKAAGITTATQAKGQRQELEALATAIQTGGEWPIPLWQQVQAMEIAFAVDRLIQPAG
jgi:predicted dehydrogenase/threonine dehydrogenase-like Zn-dependent dehydrogenase